MTTLKLGDTYPPLIATLTDENDAAIDLTDATSVDFRMVDSAGAVIVDEVTCSIASPKTSGVVQYDWADLDTAVAGLFKGDFKVTYTGGDVSHHPNNGYLLIEILESPVVAIP